MIKLIFLLSCGKVFFLLSCGISTFSQDVSRASRAGKCDTGDRRFESHLTQQTARIRKKQNGKVKIFLVNSLGSCLSTSHASHLYTGTDSYPGGSQGIQELYFSVRGRRRAGMENMCCQKNTIYPLPGQLFILQFRCGTYQRMLPIL